MHAKMLLLENFQSIRKQLFFTHHQTRWIKTTNLDMIRALTKDKTHKCIIMRIVTMSMTTTMLLLLENLQILSLQSSFNFLLLKFRTFWLHEESYLSCKGKRLWSNIAPLVPNHTLTNLIIYGNFTFMNSLELLTVFDASIKGLGLILRRFWQEIQAIFQIKIWLISTRAFSSKLKMQLSTQK